MSEHVRVEQRRRVLSIILARPERRNAITVAMYAALADAIESAADDAAHPADHAARRGPGLHRRQRPRRFPAGDAAPIGSRTFPCGGCSARWRKNQVPVVAAVHGNAVGIGTTMLFHCDFVLAEEGTPLRHAVRGPGAGAGSGELADLPAPRRPPPGRALSACWASRSDPRRRLGIRAWPAISPRRTASTGARRTGGRAAGQAAPKRCA